MGQIPSDVGVVDDVLDELGFLEAFLLLGAVGLVFEPIW